MLTITFYRIYLLFTYQKTDDSGCKFIYSEFMFQKVLVDGRMKGKNEMFTVNTYQSLEILNVQEDIFNSFRVAFPDNKLAHLAADLSPELPWFDRQIAAKKLGQSGNPDALPILLAALPDDPFWMVRCTMIQALESIGDPCALPTLREIAQGDGFSAVRSAAAEAIERLS
jgi:hypothetical protein